MPQDFGEALKWYRQAAEQGYPAAQYNLGDLYVKGEGVPQDHSEAVKWYRRAAEQGEPHAQYNLGRLYGTGQGVARDDVLAHMWFSLAASRLVGEERAQAVTNRELAAGVMTPAQLVEAMRRARYWQPRPESASTRVSPPPSGSALSPTTSTTASLPRPSDDARTLVLVEEVREPRSKRQPEISVGASENGQTRHITLAGEGLNAPRTVFVVCSGGFIKSLPVTDVSQPSERRVATYKVPDDVVDTMLHAPSCSLSVVEGHLLKIPPASLRAVWQRGGQAKGETADVSRGGTVPQAPTSEKSDPSKPTVFVSPYAHEALVILLEPGWTLAKKTQDATTYLLQFLPADSPTANVPRMITVTTYAGLQERVNARDFMVRSRALQSQSAQQDGATLDWTAIEQDNPRDVLFEYTLKNHPRYADQYEMQRMIAGEDGIHVILFHVKGAGVSPAERAEILRLLKRVSLKK